MVKATLPSLAILVFFSTGEVFAGGGAMSFDGAVATNSVFCDATIEDGIVVSHSAADTHLSLSPPPAIEDFAPGTLYISYYVMSDPEGIDSLEFVPAELVARRRYVVDVWNGDCGYATVTVVAAKVECKPQAEWPDYPRSDLGVGEILDCTVTPSDVPVTWSCTEGRAVIDSASGASTTLRVLDVPGDLAVTATVGGVPISTNYVVHAPEGIAYSVPYMPDVIHDRMAGAGCRVEVTIAPTNVAFENLWIEEGFSEAYNTNGYFAIPGNAPVHDAIHGAFNKHKAEHGMKSGYTFCDDIGSGIIYPWSQGHMEWRIPITWFISNGLTSTNTHLFCDGEYVEMFDIASDGVTTVSKFGAEARRTIGGQTTLTDSKGVIR